MSGVAIIREGGVGNLISVGRRPKEGKVSSMASLSGG